MSCSPDIDPIAVFNFKLPVGSYYAIPITWSALDDPNTLTDFTGASIEWEIREGSETGETVLTLSTTAGTITIATTTSTGIFNPAATADLAMVKHFHFFRVTMPGEEQQTLFKGTITPVIA